MTAWPFAPLVPLAYSLILADPPWSFRTYSAKGQRKSAQAHYACMSLADIKALPVGHLATPDAVLVMWATAPMIREALDAMETWGFAYKSMGVWHKRTRHGATAFGTGYRLRSACEPWLLGTIGNPRTSRSHRNLIEGEAREHSRKPAEAYAWAETYMSGVRRCELFARETRPAWECWGNEVGVLDAVA